MTDRSDLVREIQQARGDGARLTRAVAALDDFDRQRAAAIAAGRETDLGVQLVARRMEPRTAHELHTEATNWLADFEDPGRGSFRTAMIAEAATWYQGLDAAVRGDAGELGEQARGRARTLASAYGSRAPAAEREFLSYIGYLHQGASGLPQIDQTIDPNNAPAPTPYPTEVFPTFGEEQDPFNQVEDNAHGSQISSDGAPMIQQVRQQDGSGSGFGSGPERPDQHSTGMDTSDSYAEVPLGTPGQIPTTPAATDSMAGSHPNPVAGVPQDAGADRRQAARAVEGYSAPDPFGYRWLTTGEVMHPFHERCATAHWPEETCGRGTEHTASVAVGYEMDLDTARRLAQCEAIGAREGQRAVSAAASPAHLAARHNAVTAAWGGSERTAEDTAVLHGFMATVRPVLARDFTEAERAAAEKKGDALPGGKLPVENASDLKNAERLKGHVKGVPASEVSSYMERKEHEFGKAASAGGRLDFKAGVYDPDHDGDNDATPEGDTDHDWWSTDGRQLRPTGMRKGAPFAGYENFDACVAANQDKDDPSAYCGAIKHQAEGSRREATVPSVGCPGCHRRDVQLIRSGDQNAVKCPSCGTVPYTETSQIMHHEGASSLTQVQQVTDPNNVPTPQADDLPEGVAFPLNEAWTQQWETGPEGAQPKRQAEAASRMNGLPGVAAEHFGHADALDGRDPQHKDNYPYSVKAHGTYLRSWNATHAGMTARDGKPPLTREGYGQLTGRPDLYPHWKDAYDQANRIRDSRQAARRTAAGSGTGGHPEEPHCADCGHKPGCDCPHKCTYGEHLDEHGQRTARAVTADTFSQPHQTTDDFAPPFNSPGTAPQPQSSNGMAQDSDYAAGAAAARADRASGQRPAFADNSSAVSPYVKGYAEAYGAPEAPQGAQDVPASMGGDSGQPMLDQEAQKAQMVARGSRISDAFVPAALHSDPDFRKGYGYASAWKPGMVLVTTGSAEMEAGIYAGITDRPPVQDSWLAAHAVLADQYPELGRRVALHRSFSRKTAGSGLRAQGAYLVRTAGTSTDLITDGPGTSPDPMGATPLNGPGTPPPMGGLDEAATPGGPAPYQGAPPLPGGPVAPDDVMGKPQRRPEQSGPFTNTFSGDHPENATLAPVAPNTADQPGYSNSDAYAGDPHGSDRMASFRARVQASLASIPVESLEAAR